MARPDYLKCIVNVAQQAIPRYARDAVTGEMVAREKKEGVTDLREEQGEWIKFEDLIESFDVSRKVQLTSYCGRNVNMEWFFTCVEHALGSAKNQDRQVACPECVAAAMKILLER